MTTVTDIDPSSSASQWIHRLGICYRYVDIKLVDKKGGGSTTIYDMHMLALNTFKATFLEREKLVALYRTGMHEA